MSMSDAPLLGPWLPSPRTSTARAGAFPRELERSPLIAAEAERAARQPGPRSPARPARDTPGQRGRAFKIAVLCVVVALAYKPFLFPAPHRTPGVASGSTEVSAGPARALRFGPEDADTAIVFYTAFGDRALLSEALDAGARGFVLKEAPLVDLVRAVERVAGGDAYVDPVLAGVLVSGQLADRVPALTQRERETLRLLADGLSNEEIGKRLHISPETVRTHVRKAMAKLEADTRTQAVATALRQSLIS